jgi:hypothetical protein
MKKYLEDLREKNGKTFKCGEGGIELPGRRRMYKNEQMAHFFGDMSWVDWLNFVQEQRMDMGGELMENA